MRVALCAFRLRRTRKPQALQRVRGPLGVMREMRVHTSSAVGRFLWRGGTEVREGGGAQYRGRGNWSEVRAR